jgi:hypothetical protein
LRSRRRTWASNPLPLAWSWLDSSKLIYVFVSSNQIVCVWHNFIHVPNYSMVFHSENPDYIHTLCSIWTTTRKIDL